MTYRYMVDLLDETQLWTLQQRLKRIDIVTLWQLGVTRDALATADNLRGWAKAMRLVGPEDMAADLEVVYLSEDASASGRRTTPVGLFQYTDAGSWTSIEQSAPASFRRSETHAVCSHPSSLIERLARNLKDRS